MINVQDIWCTDSEIWIRTVDGREAVERFADYQPLRNASPAERRNFTRSPFGVHWPDLDEDLLFEGFFAHEKQ